MQHSELRNKLHQVEDKTLHITMTIRKIVPLLFVVALAIMGCGGQRGRFYTDGVQLFGLGPVIGCIGIVRGYSAKTLNTADTGEENLLYLVIVCPDVQRNDAGNVSDEGEDDYGTYVTTITQSWNTSAGLNAVTVRWNRQADTVSIGKQEFIREKGNLFIMRCKAGGETGCQQLANLGPHVGVQGVLESIRKQLPNDKIINTLTLLK